MGVYMKKLLAILLILSNVTFSTEIDNFSGSPDQLKDSYDQLNIEINRRIYLGFKNVKSCNSKTFDQDLRDALLKEIVGGFYGKNFYSKIETFIDESPLFEKVNVSLKDSIYRDLDALKFFGISLGGLGAVIKLKNYVVGSDKLCNRIWLL